VKGLAEYLHSWYRLRALIYVILTEFDSKDVMTVVLVSFLKKVSALPLRVFAANLKKKGHNVVLVFADATRFHQEESVTLFVEELLSFQPALIGLNVYSYHQGLARAVTERLHLKSMCPVVWGGPHATSHPDSCLSISDYVCVGEGEDALLDLCLAIKSCRNTTSIHNIWTKKGPEEFKTPIRPLLENLDSLPFPTWSHRHQYIWNDRSFTLLTLNELPPLMEYKYDIMTSRGCPYNCAYCYNSSLRSLYKNQKAYVRRRSVAHVIDELKTALSIFPELQFINFWDDCFVQDQGYLETFCEVYKETINLPFYCLSRIEFLNDRTIQLLKHAGLAATQIGIQAASKKVLHRFNRTLPDRQQLRKTGKALNKAGIYTIYDLILNNPYESVHDLAETIMLFLNMPRPFVLNGWSLVFTPGTSLFQKAQKDGYIRLSESEAFCDFMYATLNSPIFFPFDNELPQGFYRCNYRCDEKTFLNSLLAMMSTWPNILIRLLYHARFMKPLWFLMFLWKKDLLVSDRNKRLSIKYAQLDGIDELINRNCLEKAEKITKDLLSGTLLDKNLRRLCYRALLEIGERRKRDSDNSS